jgi:hypothetical protein
MSLECALLHVLCVMAAQRIFLVSKLSSMNWQNWPQVNKKHVIDQEPKAYPKQGVFLLHVYGFAHSWIHLFTEHGNPTSNHSISYNWVRVWYVKISRFYIILYLNNDTKCGRRGIFLVAWITKCVTWRQMSMFLKAMAGILFYNLETWLCKLLAGD